MKKCTGVLLLVAFVSSSVTLLSPLSFGAPSTQRLATRFFSNGDLISGWYWLRDPAFEQVAEWVFEGIPPGTGDLVLNLEVLATDRVDGPRGKSARFFLSYGIPPTGNMGGLIVGTKEVVLPNVSPPSDPVGYTCRGQVTIPRTDLENASALWVRAHRFPGPFLPGKNSSTVHVAFHRESAILLLGTPPSPGPTPTGTPPPGTLFGEPDAD